MKRLSLVFLFFAAFGMLFLGSCSNEEKLSTYEPNSVEGGKISFVLPLQKKGSVVYTTKAPVVGLDDEYKVENLFIYWFTEVTTNEYRLAQIFSTDDNTIDIDSLPRNSTTPYNEGLVSILVEGGSADKSRFYILANVNIPSPGSVNNVTSSALDNLTVGTTGTKAEDFEIIASDVLKDGANFKLISTPLPMSINKSAGAGMANGALGYVYVPNPQNVQGVITDVQMKRRVARFDIKNNMQYSNFKITRILVANGQTQGYLHDRPLNLNDEPAKSWNKADIYIPCSANGTTVSATDDETWVDGFKVTGTNVKGDDIPDIFQINAPDGQGNPTAAQADSMELNPAAFYLWPTKLTQDATTGTEILVEGVYMGVTKLYKLILPKDASNNPLTDLDIEANKLYTIKITRVSDKTLGFQLVVTDWEDNQEMEVDVPSKDILWGSLRDAKTNTVLQDLSASSMPATPIVYSSTLTDTFKLAIDVKGRNRGGNGGVINVKMKYKGAPDVDFLQSDWSATNIMSASDNLRDTTFLTYSAMYQSLDTIILPPTDAPMEFTLELYNSANPSEVKVLNMKSVCFHKKGAAVGTVIDPSAVTPAMASLGKGRWEKAVVSNLDAAGNVTEVHAMFGEVNPIKETDIVVIGTDARASADDMLTYLSTSSIMPSAIQAYCVANAGKAIEPTLAGTDALASVGNFTATTIGGTVTMYNILMVSSHTAAHLTFVNSAGQLFPNGLDANAQWSQGIVGGSLETTHVCVALTY